MALLAIIAVVSALGAGSGKAARAAAAEGEAAHAVVLAYHRIGDAERPSTSVTLAQFRRHLTILAEEGYTVMALPEILAALDAGRPLPDRTVAITLDDGFRSAHAAAWPLLRRHGFPATLFVVPDAVDAGGSGMLSWDDIREMQAQGATIGAQAAGHELLPDLPPSEIDSVLIRARDRIAAETGAVPHLFAYPYGAASTVAMDRVAAAGYTAAFGVHSGAIGVGTERLFLPRFELNEAYGDAERFRMVSAVLPLPVSELTPADPAPPASTDRIAFSVSASAGKLERLACYHNRSGKLAPAIAERRVGLALPATGMPPGRSRINCTLPVSEPGGTRWRWYGRQFYVPR